MQLEDILVVSQNRIASVEQSFRRYLFNEIDWRSRLIGIKGARGTGKTTLVLQWIQSQKFTAAEAAYFSLDELYFTQHTLVDTAQYFRQRGGRVLVLDEVHKYPTWSAEIKNLYDRYDDLKIIFTGSSIMEITRQEGDLSRRALLYELWGLSYREFLRLRWNLDLPVLTLPDILHESGIRELVPSEFRPLAHFAEYLRFGYYPFYDHNPLTYYQRLRQMSRAIVEFDMAELRGFDIRHAKKILQLLYVVAQQVPFKPNITSLAAKTGIHRNSITNYLYFLQEARLLQLLQAEGDSTAILQKPEKVLLNNTNLLYALSESTPSVGTVREVFFNSQLQVNHRICHSPKADFQVNGTYTFEIGGKAKKNRQISGLASAWVVKDELEYPVDRSLPLWAFGFLY